MHGLTRQSYFNIKNSPKIGVLTANNIAVYLYTCMPYTCRSSLFLSILAISVFNSLCITYHALCLCLQSIQTCNYNNNNNNNNNNMRFSAKQKKNVKAFVTIDYNNT